MDGDEAILQEGGVEKQCPPPASRPLLPPWFQALAGDCLRQGPHQPLQRTTEDFQGWEYHRLRAR